MSCAIITQEKVNKIIQENWKCTLRYLHTVTDGDPQRISILMKQHSIFKPTLENIAEECFELGEDARMWRGLEGAMSLLCAYIAADIVMEVCRQLQGADYVASVFDDEVEIDTVERATSMWEASIREDKTSCQGQ